ncbi:MAG: hypothetical protein PHC38_04225 [Weeksellaceae bacterium]|jgi:hypothetical protein|nr:hypothetical protein [Weeksellaceae bacterium]
MTIKRALIWIIAIVVVLMVVYFNSDFYLLKIAEKERNKKIEEYDRMEKKYMAEGVYSFLIDVTEDKTVRNKFGREVTQTVIKGKQSVEFSFTSDELIIDYPYQWSINNSYKSMLLGIQTKLPSYYQVREVIRFSKDYVFGTNGTWYFYPTSWKLINSKTDEVIYDVMTEMNYDKPIFVYLDAKDNPILGSNISFLSVDKDLHFNEKIESYMEGFLPLYCTNFKYPDEVYELEQYKPRKSWNDMLRKVLKND